MAAPESILKLCENWLTATGRPLDPLVYKLYDLSDEEVALVEGWNE